jgi:hypothetical protein
VPIAGSTVGTVDLYEVILKLQPAQFWPGSSVVRGLIVRLWGVPVLVRVYLQLMTQVRGREGH